MNNYKCFHFIMPVWGGSYIASMKEILLPMLFSYNNLPSLNHKPYFTLCMLKTEYIEIEQDSVISKLKELTYFKVVFLDDAFSLLNQQDMNNFKFNINLHKMTIAQNIAIKSLGNKNGIGQVFLQPDQIFFDGAFKNLELLINENPNINIFLCYGLHVLLDKLTKELKPYNKYNSISVSNHDLTKMILNSLHPMSENSIVSSSNFFPTGNMFFKEKDTLIAMMTIQHPIVVFSNTLIPEEGTFDNGSYIKNIIKNHNEIYHIEDTQIFHACSTDSVLQKEFFSQPYGSNFNSLKNALHIVKHLNPFYYNSLKYNAIFTYNTKVVCRKKELTNMELYRNKLFYWLDFFKKYPEVIFNWEDLELKIFHGKTQECLSIIEQFLLALDDTNTKQNTLLVNKLKLEHNAIVVIEKLSKILNNIGGGEGFVSLLEKKYKQTFQQLLSVVNLYPNRIALYGAGEDTNFLLNVIDSKLIVKIFDDSIEKQNTQICNIKIEEFPKDLHILKKEIDVVAIVSTNFHNEIYKKINYIQDFDIKIIIIKT